MYLNYGVILFVYIFYCVEFSILFASTNSIDLGK